MAAVHVNLVAACWVLPDPFTHGVTRSPQLQHFTQLRTACTCSKHCQTAPGFPQTCQSIPRPHILCSNGLFSPVFVQPCILPVSGISHRSGAHSQVAVCSLLGSNPPALDPFQPQLITAEGVTNFHRCVHVQPL